MAAHCKCAIGSYPKASQVVRKVKHISWSQEDAQYTPTDYTAPSILSGPSYADKLISDATSAIAWNTLDGAVDRRSHDGVYAVVGAVPRNPRGRTGVVGRGLLGRWGPNHAADPVVTRWKRGPDGAKILHEASVKPVLQLVVIFRGDGGGWALPGGMVDPGEMVSETLKREFMEEAMNSNEMTDEQRQKAKEKMAKLFQGGDCVYRGYVDDPRNTDNAWMETVAQNFHEEEPGLLQQLELAAGDDAKAVRWRDVNSSLSLYASHTDIVRSVATLRNAHCW